MRKEGSTHELWPYGIFALYTLLLWLLLFVSDLALARWIADLPLLAEWNSYQNYVLVLLNSLLVGWLAAAAHATCRSAAQVCARA